MRSREAFRSWRTGLDRRIALRPIGRESMRASAIARARQCACPVQRAHRARLPPLDDPVPRVHRPAKLRRAGCRADDRISQRAGDARSRRGLDAEPGPGGDPVPLPRRARPGSAVARQSGSGEDACPHSGRAHPRRGSLDPRARQIGLDRASTECSFVPSDFAVLKEPGVGISDAAREQVMASGITTFTIGAPSEHEFKGFPGRHIVWRLARSPDA